jgi:hypothetical protein
VTPENFMSLLEEFRRTAVEQVGYMDLRRWALKRESRDGHRTATTILSAVGAPDERIG